MDSKEAQRNPFGWTKRLLEVLSHLFFRLQHHHDGGPWDVTRPSVCELARQEQAKKNPEARAQQLVDEDWERNCVPAQLASQVASIMFPHARMPLAQAMASTVIHSSLSEEDVSLLKQFGLVHRTMEALEDEALARLQPEAMVDAITTNPVHAPAVADVQRDIAAADDDPAALEERVDAMDAARLGLPQVSDVHATQHSDNADTEDTHVAPGRFRFRV